MKTIILVVTLLLLGMLISCEDVSKESPSSSRLKIQKPNKFQTFTQSGDTPFSVPAVVVEKGETVFVTVRCNTPSHLCLAEPPKDQNNQNGRYFTLISAEQKKSTQEDKYSLENALGKVETFFTPENSFHKVHEGWDYVVIIEVSQ